MLEPASCIQRNEGGGSSEAKPMPPIVQQLDALKRVVDDLDETVKALGERVKPISQLPGPSSDEGAKAPPEMGSSVCQCIYEAVAHARLLQGRLADIISNLEI